jgi:hypothetical protein
MFTPHERARLRAETQCDLATISRWEKGLRVQDASRVRLTRAARLLGLALPEPPRQTAPTEREVA